MDTSSIAAPIVEAGKPSRLPAGSTLEVNGIHVAHPHAEVNLPGAGDPRVGDTKAVTERFEHSFELQDAPTGPAQVVVTTSKLVSEPLADSVKPKVPTFVSDGKVGEKKEIATGPETAKPVDLNIAVEHPTLEKTA